MSMTVQQMIISQENCHQVISIQRIFSFFPGPAIQEIISDELTKNAPVKNYK
jgi:hypothetical protein